MRHDMADKARGSGRIPDAIVGDFRTTWVMQVPRHAIRLPTSEVASCEASDLPFDGAKTPHHTSNGLASCGVS